MNEQRLLLPGNSVLRRVMVACGLTLFGCCDSTPTDGSPEDDFFVVTGLVLEYTDASRTTTVPVVDAMLEVILPDGETREECFGNIFGGPVDCIDVEWVAQAWTNMDSTGLRSRTPNTAR